MQHPSRSGHSAAWLSIAGAAVLGLLHWIPLRRSPMSTYLLVVALLVPGVLAASWSSICDGLHRAVCGAGAALAIVGWLIWALPVGSPMVAFELLGDGALDFVGVGQLMIGLGLGLALLGVALSRRGPAAGWAFAGVGAAVVAALLPFVVGSGPGWLKIAASLQAAALVLPAAGTLRDADAPVASNGGDWSMANSGAKRVGGVMVAFFIMGLVVNRVPATDSDALAAVVALGQTLASLVLLLVAASGLARLAKAPLPKIRAVGSLGRAGAWAAAGSAVLTLVVFTLAAAGLVEGVSPQEVQFALPTFQAAGWVVAVVCTAVATSAIAKAGGENSLSGLGIATALAFFVASLLLAAGGATGLRAFDGSESSLVPLAGGALLSLVSIVMFLRLVNKVADPSAMLTHATQSTVHHAKPSSGYVLGAPAASGLAQR